MNLMICRLDPTTFLNKLPDFFKACFTIMSNQPTFAKPASEALMVVIFKMFVTLIIIILITTLYLLYSPFIIVIVIILSELVSICHLSNVTLQACISECTSDVIMCASEMSRSDDSPVHRLVKEMTNTYSMLFMRVMETILAITQRLVEVGHSRQLDYLFIFYINFYMLSTVFWEVMQQCHEAGQLITYCIEVSIVIICILNSLLKPDMGVYRSVVLINSNGNVNLQYAFVTFEQNLNLFITCLHFKA